MAETPRIVVGVTGASGAALALRLLEALKRSPVEVHLVLSEMGRRVFAHETGRDPAVLESLAAHVHAPGDLFAPIASGSFRVRGMAVVPCSMKTLAGIASGYTENLLLRAADVCLKERRRLVLVAREAPLSLIHIENMRQVTLAGAVVLPPVVTLYTGPTGLEQVLDQIVGKVLDLLEIDVDVRARWG